jgi:hypothetical protein
MVLNYPSLHDRVSPLSFLLTFQQSMYQLQDNLWRIPLWTVQLVDVNVQKAIPL